MVFRLKLLATSPPPYLDMKIVRYMGKMRTLMAEDSIGMPNNSFLLEVDSR
ncbi:hypothetical protein HanXRQr2_Chr09g0369731 [Helianthus annuus]|uniref:Uncharacterized protein n=1 Tax=Helianthus annuus TaxID=4232 RepID=A0A251TRY3_HELAN|nr:hypothetical protein HanXRQr2_Chr09g0369731 [Helianthus annuus]KAJ0891622.1 hypothetical protein HanPSC8_Chr09g0356181 [Helianthus annuus]